MNSIFYSIKLMFSNRFRATHSENCLDTFDFEIPTFADDRKNSLSDFKAIGGDMKKSLKAKQAETHHK